MIEWSDIKHFTKEEFACKCCGVCEMDMELVKTLDDTREQLDFPIAIQSGYRCAKHNKEVDGKENSAHLRGKAIDVKMILSRSRYVFLSVAFRRFKRIGIGKTFIHVDNDETLPQLVAWMY